MANHDEERYLHVLFPTHVALCPPNVMFPCALSIWPLVLPRAKAERYCPVHPHLPTRVTSRNRYIPVHARCEFPVPPLSFDRRLLHSTQDQTNSTPKFGRDGIARYALPFHGCCFSRTDCAHWVSQYKVGWARGLRIVWRNAPGCSFLRMCLRLGIFCPRFPKFLRSDQEVVWLRSVRSLWRVFLAELRWDNASRR